MLIVNIFIFNSANSKEYKIIAKVDDEIITNIDIMNQNIFLTIFNPSLKNLNGAELNKLSKQSLIKELIKKKEVNKYFSINDNSILGENLIENTYKKQGYTTKADFLIFLKNLNF